MSKIRRDRHRPGDVQDWGLFIESTDTLHVYPTRGLRDLAARNLTDAGVEFRLLDQGETKDFIEFAP